MSRRPSLPVFAVRLRSETRKLLAGNRSLAKAIGRESQIDRLLWTALQGQRKRLFRQCRERGVDPLAVLTDAGQPSLSEPPGFVYITGDWDKIGQPYSD